MNSPINNVEDFSFIDDTHHDADGFFANLNSDEYMEKFMQKLEKDNQAKTDFFASPLCERMVQDMITKDGFLNDEYFAYNAEKVKEEMNWQDIKNEDIDMFMLVMSEEHMFPVDHPTQVQGEDISSVKIFRRGLVISMLFGQGCSLSIRKA